MSASVRVGWPKASVTMTVTCVVGFVSWLWLTSLWSLHLLTRLLVDFSNLLPVSVHAYVCWDAFDVYPKKRYNHAPLLYIKCFESSLFWGKGRRRRRRRWYIKKLYYYYLIKGGKEMVVVVGWSGKREENKAPPLTFCKYRVYLIEKKVRDLLLVVFSMYSWNKRSASAWFPCRRSKLMRRMATITRPGTFLSKRDKISWAVL